MNYVLVIVSIGTLILIHEAGHLLGARVTGLPVASFSIGMGPKLFGLKINGIEYRISVIPLGGYVSLDLNSLEQMFGLPVWKRVFFLLCGPLANLLVIIPLFALINVYFQGVSVNAVLLQPLQQSLMLAGSMLGDIGQVFSQPQQMAGIVGIVAEAGKAMNGLPFFLFLTAFLSLNFAVFNLLPIPVLDGGQILLSLLEKVTPKVQKARLPLAIAGWVLMIGLIIYVTTLDIQRILA